MKAGDFVYDPFVGSGSIAIACAHFGGVVFGSDLDQRVLRGYAVGRKSYNKDVVVEQADKDDLYNIFTNFKHYGLPLPEIFSQDILKPFFRPSRLPQTTEESRSPLLDAIVCDPPYGIRARSRKLD